ncbi:MAG: hypothetical protein HKN16_07245, partial [Saprospiraceae bacterium]|nr:hypothetical protein [Saprospiraceae bacterium]
MKGQLLLFLGILFAFPLFGQQDSTQAKLDWEADFRFRIEQDWDSRKSDGTFRDDRTRLRYRVRLGASYKINEWAKAGIR